MTAKDYIEFWTKMSEIKFEKSVSDMDIQQNLAMWYLELTCEKMNENDLDSERLCRIVNVERARTRELFEKTIVAC